MGPCEFEKYNYRKKVILEAVIKCATNHNINLKILIGIIAYGAPSIAGKNVKAVNLI